MLDRGHFNLYKACLAKLFERHTCVHLHANNWADVTLMHNMAIPSVLEISLLRNDRDTFVPYAGPLPTALDVPNHPYRPDIILRPF